jgi:hypothetical protein
MSSPAQELAFLRDVWRSAGRQAAVRLPPSLVDRELSDVAQRAAKRFYGDGELPVWAADTELTATHLARRRASMDPWAYAAIVREMGRLYCQQPHQDVPPLLPTPEGDDATSYHDDHYEAGPGGGLGSLQEDVREAAQLIYASGRLELPVWGGVLLHAAQQAAQTVYGGDIEELPVWAADVELTASHLVRRRGSIDPQVYAAVVRQMGRCYYGHAIEAGAEMAAATTDDEGSESASDTVSDVFDEDEPSLNLDHQIPVAAAKVGEQPSSITYLRLAEGR